MEEEVVSKVEGKDETKDDLEEEEIKLAPPKKKVKRVSLKEPKKPKEDKPPKERKEHKRKTKPKKEKIIEEEEDKDKPQKNEAKAVTESKDDIISFPLNPPVITPNESSKISKEEGVKVTKDDMFD